MSQTLTPDLRSVISGVQTMTPSEAFVQTCRDLGRAGRD